MSHRALTDLGAAVGPARRRRRGLRALAAGAAGMIAASLAAAYLALLLLKAWLAIRAARRMPPRAGRADLSRVVIVQPVLSGDPRLEDTLARQRPRAAVGALRLAGGRGRSGRRRSCAGGCARRHAGARIEVLIVPPPPPGRTRSSSSWSARAPPGRRQRAAGSGRRHAHAGSRACRRWSTGWNGARCRPACRAASTTGAGPRGCWPSS